MTAHEVHFLQDYDYTPSTNRLVTYAYKRGMRLVVDEECEGIVVARGIAVYADFAEDELFDRSRMLADQADFAEVEQFFHDLEVEEEADAKDYD